MKKLLVRMLREIKNNKGQFISIVLIIAIGSFMFSGMLSSIMSIKKGVANYYEDQNLADLWASVQSISEDQVKELSDVAELEVEGRYTINLDAVIDESNISLRAHNMTDINTLYLSEGYLPESLYECVVDSKFANANDLEIGDTIELYSSKDNAEEIELKENNTRLSIVGIADSPEYAHKIKDGATALVSHKTFGIAFCTEETLIDLMKGSQIYLEAVEDIKSKYNNNEMLEEAIKNLDKSMLGYQELVIQTDNVPAAITLLEKQDYLIAYTELEDQGSYSVVQGGIDTISTVSYIFPFVFFMVAALILLISMTKMVENQRTQIAVIQAMGITKGKIRMSFIFYAIIASAFGSFLFSYLGNLLIPKVLLQMFMKRFSLGTIEALLNPLLLTAPFLLASICSCAAAVMATRGVLKEVPAQAMRPKPPKKSKTILIERITCLWCKLSYSSKLIYRNLFLNKSRILLSSIGVICSVMLMITGLSLRHSATSLLEAKKDSIAYDLSIVYNDIIENASDLSFRVDVEAIELTKNLRATLPAYDNSSISLQILPENSQMIRLFDPKGVRLPIEKNTVMIPQTIADDYDISVGETLDLMVNEEIYSFTVTDISVQYTSNVIYIEELAAEEAGLDVSCNTAMVKLTNGNDTLRLQEELIDNRDIRAVNSKADAESSVLDNLEMLNVIIFIIITAAAVMTIAVIYNITSINLFERAREFATLMVLGYYKKEVSRLLFTENMVITGLGCIGGLPCGIILFKIIVNSFSSSGVILPSQVETTNVIIAYTITILISIMTNILLQKKVKEIDMIESLKGVE